VVQIDLAKKKKKEKMFLSKKTAAEDRGFSHIMEKQL
jgi:hypothetical protein